MKASRFAVATHVLVSLEFQARQGEPLVSSAGLATSVNTNPVIVRELLRKLSRANLVLTKEGRNGGVQLARRAAAITLRDVYDAVEEAPPLKPNSRPVHKPCPVSCGITSLLAPIVDDVNDAIRKVLGRQNIATLTDDIKR